MKFEGGKIFIDGEWHTLCACDNCGEVHAIHEDFKLVFLDNQIKCCKKPNNYYYSVYDYQIVSDLITKFIKKWKD